MKMKMDSYGKPFLRRPQKMMKSSPSIWRYVVNVKSTVKISSIFVAFLENMNFTMRELLSTLDDLEIKIGSTNDFLKTLKTYILFVEKIIKVLSELTKGSPLLFSRTFAFWYYNWGPPFCSPIGFASKHQNTSPYQTWWFRGTPFKRYQWKNPT